VFFSCRRRHTSSNRYWSSDVCSSDLLLDSDALITAKNLHYRPDFCQGFWEWVEQGNLAQKIFSIDTVYQELCTGDSTDFLHGWRSEERRVGNECGSVGDRGRGIIIGA